MSPPPVRPPRPPVASRGESSACRGFVTRSESVGGISVVSVPHASWADMAEPDPPFMKLLAEKLGSPEAARETMEQLQGSFEEGSYTIYALRPDLSTPR